MTCIGSAALAGTESVKFVTRQRQGLNIAPTSARAVGHMLKKGETPTKTLIAIPCFDMVHADFMKSMIDLKKPGNTSYTIIKNTLIHDARNIIAANAIQAGFDRVMWFDSDMVFAPDTLLHLSNVMDSQGMDFLSGLYFTRRPPNIRPVAFQKMWWKLDEDGKVDTGAENYFDYPDGVAEIEAAGFGCCLTSVDLIKRVSDEYGAPFNPLPTMGEDISFCWRARQIGAKLFCDFRVKAGHQGILTYDESLYKR